MIRCRHDLDLEGSHSGCPDEREFITSITKLQLLLFGLITTYYDVAPPSLGLYYGMLQSICLTFRPISLEQKIMKSSNLEIFSLILWSYGPVEITNCDVIKHLCLYHEHSNAVVILF